MQFQADILNAEVVRPAVAETTALGAAYLAALQRGFMNADEIGRQTCDRFIPQMTDAERTEKLLLWEQALARELYTKNKSL